MNVTSAKLILDSSINGVRVLTFELCFPRFLLAQLNTHRTFSRSAASSRAVPHKTLLLSCCYVPAEFPVNGPGMQPRADMTGWRDAVARLTWKAAMRCAKMFAGCLHALGVHKEICNRLLEPFLYVRVVMTTGLPGLQNFFNLRLHGDAQHDMQILARKMADAFAVSTPTRREIHLPYVDDRRTHAYRLYVEKNVPEILQDIRTSVARCARVSYLRNNKPSTIADDLWTYQKLVGSQPIHACYDAETEVLTTRGFIKWPNVQTNDSLATVDPRDSKFQGFERPAQLLSYSLINEEMYHIVSHRFNLMITPSHQIYASKPWGSQVFSLRPANERVAKSPFEVVVASPLKMLNCALTSKANYVDCLMWSEDDPQFGKLVGFFLGDGSVPRDIGQHGGRRLTFHLKKPRKIAYLRAICKTLNFELVEKPHYNTYWVARDGLAKEFHTLLYDINRQKCLPDGIYESSPEFVHALMDGLKNSDGSIKRHTWTYATTSPKLADQIQTLGALHGYNFSLRQGNRHRRSHKSQPVFSLNLCRRPSSILNDSRHLRKNFSKIKYTGEVYCATVSTGLLIVRRNGKTCVSGNSPAEMQVMHPDLAFWLAPRSDWGVDKKIVLDPWMSGNLPAGVVQFRKILEKKS